MEYFKIATEWPIVRRAILMAIVVGFVLVSINHGMCVYKGMFSLTCFWQCALTFLVPYSVSTISSVLAVKSSRAAAAGRN